MEEGAYRQKEAQAIATRNLAIQLAGNDPVQQGIAMGNAEKYIDFKLAQLKPDYKTRPVRKGTQAYDEYSIDGGKTWEKVPGSGPYDMKAASGAASIDLKIGQKQGEAFAKPISDKVDIADSALSDSIRVETELARLEQNFNNPNLIAGFGANVRLPAARVAQLLGGDGADLAVTRSTIQGFAEIALQSRGMLKGQGQVTENEQKLLDRARSGDISFSIPELKELVGVLSRANRARYDDSAEIIRRLEGMEGTDEAKKFYKVKPFPTRNLKKKYGLE
jgi:hypothetical protein